MTFKYLTKLKSFLIKILCSELRYLPQLTLVFVLFVFCLHVCLCLFFVCLFVGNTLTPLTPIPVSDVGKTMLQPTTLSVLGDQQFQGGLFTFLFHFAMMFFVTIPILTKILFSIPINFQ